MGESHLPPGYRRVALGPLESDFVARADGTMIVRNRAPLGAYPARITARLEHWAAVAPARPFLARRDHGGDWRVVTFGQAYGHVRAIGQALLDRGLSPERPVAILSGNSIEHALLAIACMHVGVPYTSVSTAYSLVSRDFGRLRQVLGVLTPGLVLAEDGVAYSAAIAAAVAPDCEVVVVDRPTAGRAVTDFASLLATTPTPDVEAATARVGPDTIAKFLFTSGSTGHPKGVINTQRMVCSNQEMIASVFPVLREAPPVLVDWLPWNHTFGGNHNTGITLYHGGTLYIDDGRPTAEGFPETIRNLREIAPTVYFNVPKGFEELVRHLRRDADLARTFFARVSLMFYAGAGLAQHVWDELDAAAVATVGERIVMTAGIGATETAPSVTVTRADCNQSGIIGLPLPGQEIKLVPTGDKREMRVRGPNVMPGYWRNPEATRAAFDAEGFYRMNDALAFVDDADWQKGFRFDGRITEDFKLATGTWVSVGPLRARLARHLAPLLRDSVIAGVDQDFVTALIVPDIDACAALCPKAADPLGHPTVIAALRAGLRAMAQESTGSSTRVVRVAILREPPSIDAGEVTDKGSLNQRALLTRRAALVGRLYAEPPPADIIAIDATDAIGPSSNGVQT